MKILMISPTPTHPTTAGNRARVLTLVRALHGLGHEVHFALATVAPTDDPAMRQLFGENLHILECRSPYRVSGLLPRAARKLLRLARMEAAYLWALDDHYDSALTPQIRELCRRIAFDAVFVEYVFMSKAFEAVPPGVPKILDTHDRFALRHRVFLNAGQRPQWFSTTVAEETRGLLRADHVLAIQEQEAVEFATQLGAHADRVLTVGHLLDLPPRVAPARTPSAVFLASGNPINVDGARYFIDKVLPLVRRVMPDFRLLLAGDVGAEFGSHGDAVQCLGRVNAVSDAFAAAAISINPVRLGTGLNIKMLEALACGAACITSATGSRGLEQHAGTAFDVVPDDDPAAMAYAVVALLRDPSRAARLADAGIRLAQSWNDTQLGGLAKALSRREVAAGCNG